MAKPKIIAIAGLDGAGESTLAPFLLRGAFEMTARLEMTAKLIVEHAEAIEKILRRAVRHAFFSPKKFPSMKTISKMTGQELLTPQVKIKVKVVPV